MHFLGAFRFVVMNYMVPLKLSLLGVLAENRGLEKQRSRSKQLSMSIHAACRSIWSLFSLFLHLWPIVRPGRSSDSVVELLLPSVPKAGGRSGATRFPWESLVLLSRLPTQAVQMLAGPLLSNVFSSVTCENITSLSWSLQKGQSLGGWKKKKKSKGKWLVWEAGHVGCKAPCSGHPSLS